jgi:uncharacterized metal-binding protein YceD (DUF177 family)
MTISELRRPLAVERVGDAPFEMRVQASAEECPALAARLQIPAVLALSCDFVLRRGAAGGICAEGRLRARVVRTCVITLEDFETEMTEALAIRFVPAGTETEEIDPEAEDEIPYGGKTIDLGEAAAEQLALALEPYPRKPGATLAEEPATPGNPFAALGRLRH